MSFTLSTKNDKADKLILNNHLPPFEEWNRSGVVENFRADGYQCSFDVNENARAGRNLVRWSDEFVVGGSATGISSSITPEGWLRVDASAGNGNWLTSFLASGVSGSRINHIEDAFEEGDMVTISFEIMSHNATGGAPTFYVKSGMSYIALQGWQGSNGQWQAVHQTRPWFKENGISFHLGFNNRVGTYFIRRMSLIRTSTPPVTLTPSPDDGYLSYRLPLVPTGNHTLSFNQFASDNSVVAISHRIGNQHSNPNAVWHHTPITGMSHVDFATLNIPANAESVRVSIRPRVEQVIEDDSVWVNGIQFEEGGLPSPFQKKAMINEPIVHFDNWIPNGDFRNGRIGWNNWGADANVLIREVVQTGIREVPNAIRLTYESQSNVGVQRTMTNVNDLPRGTYTFTFLRKVITGTPISIQLARAGGPNPNDWAGIGGLRTVDLGDGWERVIGTQSFPADRTGLVVQVGHGGGNTSGDNIFTGITMLFGDRRDEVEEWGFGVGNQPATLEPLNDIWDGRYDLGHIPIDGTNENLNSAGNSNYHTTTWQKCKPNTRYTVITTGDRNRWQFRNAQGQISFFGRDNIADRVATTLDDTVELRVYWSRIASTPPGHQHPLQILEESNQPITHLTSAHVDKTFNFNRNSVEVLNGLTFMENQPRFVRNGILIEQGATNLLNIPVGRNWNIQANGGHASIGATVRNTSGTSGFSHSAEINVGANQGQWRYVEFLGVPSLQGYIGQEFVVSFWIRQKRRGDGQTGDSVNGILMNGNATNRQSDWFTIPLSRQWQRFTTIITPVVASNPQNVVYLAVDNANWNNAILEFADPQIEQRSFATSWTRQNRPNELLDIPARIDPVAGSIEVDFVLNRQNIVQIAEASIFSINGAQFQARFAFTNAEWSIRTAGVERIRIPSVNDDGRNRMRLEWNESEIVLFVNGIERGRGVRGNWNVDTNVQVGRIGVGNFLNSVVHSFVVRDRRGLPVFSTFEPEFN